jgi:[ribosomal protein S5]-alanine N-acetyltransferase
MLQTQRLFLVPSTHAMLHAAVEEDWPTLSRLLGGVDFADQWSHFPEAMVWMRDYLQDAPHEAQWWNYLIIFRSEARLIGTCGFKGQPEPDGSVEIGYEIADAYWGRGLGTEAALALTEWALRQPGVKCVTAHTLAEENASTAILRKLGFAFVEEKIDLEDGRIWAWRRG